MSLFRRKKPCDHEVVGRKKLYKLTKNWNKDKAAPYYKLWEAEELVWDDGIVELKYWMCGPMYGGLSENRQWICYSTGGLAWAQRTAKHYNITVPKEFSKP